MTKPYFLTAYTQEDDDESIYVLPDTLADPTI